MSIQAPNTTISVENTKTLENNTREEALNYCGKKDKNTAKEDSGSKLDYNTKEDFDLHVEQTQENWKIRLMGRT